MFAPLLFALAAPPSETPPAPPPAPPAAVRVDFDRRGLTRVRTTGLADRRTGRAVSADDPVRIASISKLVTALGVMRLVEAGRLDLDADVSRLLGRLLLGDGRVDGVRLLRPASVAALRRAEWRYDGANGDPAGGIYCSYGLAIQLIARTPACPDDPFGDGSPREGHAGDAYRLKSALWLDRARGTGAVWFVTQVPEDAPRGRSAWTAAEEAMAR